MNQRRHTYFWEKLANKEANIWVTTLVVLAVIVFAILVVTLPGKGLRSDAAFFRTKATTTSQTTTLGKGVVTPTPTTPAIPGGVVTQTPGGPTPSFQGGPTVQPGDQGVQTPPGTPSGSPGVGAPIASSQWPVWSIQTIRWNYPSAQGIGLMLKKGGKVIEGDAGIIAWPKTVRNPNGTYSSSGGMLRNNGAFAWVVNPNLAPGSDYQVQVLDMQGQVLGESAMFSVIAPYTGITFYSPASGSTVPYGEDVGIEWTPPKFASHLDIALYKKADGYNGLGYVATNIPSSWIYTLPNGHGLWTWSVSNNLLSQVNGNGPFIRPGDELEIIFSDRDNPAHSGHMSVKIAP